MRIDAGDGWRSGRGAGPAHNQVAEPLRTDDLESISRNSDHFRKARTFLLGEGFVLVVLGVAGMVSNATHSGVGADGAPVLLLSLIWWHSGILLAFGACCLIGMARRHVAVAVTAADTIGFIVLSFVGGVFSSHHAPGPLGLENRDLLLHGVLAATNFAIMYWLLPDVLEGRDWRARSRRDAGPHTDN